MSITDRHADGYEPRFDIDLAYGKQGELWVVNIGRALAEGSERVEVKTDARAIDTGRIYVEYACKRFGGWAKSGIATTTSELWAEVIGDDTMLVTPTWRMKEVARRASKNPRLLRELVRGSHPTKGVVVPLQNIFHELFREPERRAS